jgi:hypothetical protein
VKRSCLVLPLLFAGGFVLAPFAENSNELGWRDLAPTLGAALALAAATVAVVRLFVRDDSRAALAATLAVVFAAGYGTAADVGRFIAGGGAGFASSWRFLAAWMVLVGIALVAVLRSRGGRTEAVRLAFVLGALILAEPLAILATDAWHSVPDTSKQAEVPVARPGSARQDRPDVFFVILDGYGRADVLLDKYRFDNSQFLAALERRGFLVVPASAANYAQTHLSVAASLNMGYLDVLPAALGRDTNTRLPLLGMIANNRAAAAFRQAGYRYVTLSTGYLDTALARADLAYAGSPSLSHFALAVLSRTPLAAWPALQYGFHRRRIEQAFDRLATPSAGPTFLFAHFTVPHHPFVYGRNGAPVTPGRPFSFADDVAYYRANSETRAEYRESYAAQVDYVNRRTLRAIDALLDRRRQPPVIVLQGDHGPSVDWSDPAQVDPAERMPILNACLLPGVERARLPSTLSPLNTMRLLAGAYAGADTPLLPDRSYYSSWQRPYAFRDVTALVQSRSSGSRAAGEHE